MAEAEADKPHGLLDRLRAAFVLVVLVQMGLICIVLLFWLAFVRECPVHKIERFPSPDNRSEAMIVGRYCHQLSGYDSYIYIVPAGTRGVPTRASDYMLSEIITKAAWEGPDKFSIEYRDDLDNYMLTIQSKLEVQDVSHK